MTGEPRPVWICITHGPILEIYNGSHQGPRLTIPISWCEIVCCLRPMNHDWGNLSNTGGRTQPHSVPVTWLCEPLCAAFMPFADSGTSWSEGQSLPVAWTRTLHGSGDQPKGLHKLHAMTSLAKAVKMDIVVVRMCAEKHRQSCYGSLSRSMHLTSWHKSDSATAQPAL